MDDAFSEGNHISELGRVICDRLPSWYEVRIDQRVGLLARVRSA